ncbi:reverse transcriptase domain-containing protein [Pseudomonas chlororaphis]|uniref:reverse transcriptase domain-containing protein n=1 Tax=Pseudomonas chlororaphis TaxID=587753 RepID=UPI000D0E697A|nr:reverse transcriptase domain-containing protein [Pseudomonas chlororaphis]AVO56720.1 RNA-directed DNA polymerase [Pseudomonas chlororaphis subsp. piscium]
MNDIKIRNWLSHFRQRGVSEALVEIYAEYIKTLVGNSVPVIFEFEHLSRLMGVDQTRFRAMVNSPSSFYRTFYIKKRLGGLREISSPFPSLLMCQDWIYKNILINIPIHPCAHGFAPEKSIFTNATPHLKARCLLKMDIKDFFPSIKINWVANFFNQIGYADNVSFYLASLCCKEGRLVQGSSTSPYLTNILLYGLDQRLFGLAKTYNMTYTRYADDLTFSGEYIPHTVIDIVKSIILDFGLKPNSEKTRLQIDKNQKIVTGLSVAGDSLSAPRSFKRELKKELHFIRKFGYESHLAKKKIRKPFYLDSLIGKVNFWLQAEPNDQHAKQALVTLRELYESRKI